MKSFLLIFLFLDNLLLNPSFKSNKLDSSLLSWENIAQGFMPDIPRIDDDDSSFTSSILFVTSKADTHTYTIHGAFQSINGSNWEDNSLIRALYIGGWSKVKN